MKRTNCICCSLLRCVPLAWVIVSSFLRFVLQLICVGSSSHCLLLRFPVSRCVTGTVLLSALHSPLF